MSQNVIQVNIIGTIEDEPDVHGRLIYSLRLALDETDSETTLPPFVFRSVGIDHTFKDKKPAREFPSYDGILKYNWLQKHFDQLPSCVIYLSSFSTDWSLSEWNRREVIIQDKYLKLRSILSQRDCKVILILIKIGLNVLDKDSVEERLASLKRHLQIDTKSFHFIPINEFVIQTSLTLKKISKILREYISGYFSSQCKRIRNLEKAMVSNRSAFDMVLTARYNFKLGIFYEFLGQKTFSLKFYRISYES